MNGRTQSFVVKSSISLLEMAVHLRNLNLTINFSRFSYRKEFLTYHNHKHSSRANYNVHESHQSYRGWAERTKNQNKYVEFHNKFSN